MLLLADVNEGDGLATGVLLLCGLSVDQGRFLFCFDTFPRVVVKGTRGTGLGVIEAVQASFFELPDKFPGQ